MNGRVGKVGRRRSGAEIERLVAEYEQSGMRRREFAASRGLPAATPDNYRRRKRNPGSGAGTIAAVELVDEAVQDTAKQSCVL
jgi:transposase-like protein